MQEVKERDVPVLAGGDKQACFPGLVSQQGMLKCGEQSGVGRLHTCCDCWQEELLGGTSSGKALGTV